MAGDFYLETELAEHVDSHTEHDLPRLSPHQRASLDWALRKMLRDDGGSGEDPAELPPHIDPRSPGSVALDHTVDLQPIAA